MSHATTHAPLPTPPAAKHTPPTGHPRTVVTLTLFALALVAAGVLALTMTSPQAPAPPAQPANGSLVDVPRYPEIAERWLAHHAVRADAPAAAYGTYGGWPRGAPRSADASERWFALQHRSPAGWPVGVPRTADAADRWFARHP